VSALSLATLFAIAVWSATSRILRPDWYEHRTPLEGLRSLAGQSLWAGGQRDPKADLALDFADVAFPARDGATLRGWLVPGKPGARAGVVAVHGAHADRREFLRHVPVFNDAGYPVLLFDCREHGVSDGSGRGVSLGMREHEDVSSAVAFAKGELGLARVAVVGTSQGAVAVILAAAEDRAIDAVVAENPFARFGEVLRASPEGREAPPLAVRAVEAVLRWRIGNGATPEPLDVVARIGPTPLLLVHGTDDPVIPSSQSEVLFAAASEPKELWVVPGAKHAQVFDAEPAEWRARVGGFVARHLGPP
jgi:alpha-beta hydrolase superfamily lysophospholipase